MRAGTQYTEYIIQMPLCFVVVCVNVNADYMPKNSEVFSLHSSTYGNLYILHTLSLYKPTKIYIKHFQILNNSVLCCGVCTM